MPFCHSEGNVIGAENLYCRSDVQRTDKSHVYSCGLTRHNADLQFADRVRVRVPG